MPYSTNEAARQLSKADKSLARVICRVGPCTLSSMGMGNPFDTLVKSIIYQQLSGKAAGTIHDRVKDLFPRKRIKPSLLLEMPDDVLRGAGLSRAKLAALRDLAEKTLDGSLPTLVKLKRMDDQEIIDRLVEVRGIGPWTVEMLLMFRLGRPDIMPSTDLGIRKGFMILQTMDEMPTPKDLLARTEHWRPWRSVASWYLYRLVDEGKE